MRNLVLIFGIAMLAFVVACANPAAPPVRVENAASPSNTASVEQQHDDAPRISLADAKKDFDDGAAIIIDARNEEAYKQEHIKGALNLAKGVNDEQLNKIPKGTKIIVYCS
jgi:predicted sulfurtransferase